MPRSQRPLRLALTAAFLSVTLLTGLLTGCGSSRPAQSTAPAETTEAPSGPRHTLLYQTAEGAIVWHDTRTDSKSTIATDVASIGVQALSPDGNTLAVSYATTDSTHLALVHRDGKALQPIHAQAGSVTYSLAWHSSDRRLAFAYYAPTNTGTRGPGDVRIAHTNGSTERVGCQAAREVLHWLPDGTPVRLEFRPEDGVPLSVPAEGRLVSRVEAR